jgi:penicillin-binding protein 2
MNNDSPRLRMSLIGVVVFALFASLFARLWYLQVMATDEFQVTAQANSVREVPVEAPRGRILDRNGKVLVDNRVSVQVTIDRTELAELDDEERLAVITRLAEGLARSGIPTTVEQLEERIADERYSPYVPVPVAGDVPEELKIWIDEHGDDLRSVSAERVAVRRYPYGRLAGHVVGYTGKITEEEFEAQHDADSAKPYTLNDEIGKSGIERMYEDDLRGQPGVTLLEVDADGNTVRVIPDGTKAPVPGDDVVLNVDIDLQAVAEQALQTSLQRAAGRPASGSDKPNVGAVGSTVVLDPASGGVLAMASYPDFSPADFVDGISNTEWGYLSAAEHHYPLNNWALQGQYAPGSTFKPFTAWAALKAGLITPQTTIHDPGTYQIPGCRGGGCVKKNDGSRAYGTVDLRKSLTVSSDVFYYGLGARFWVEQDNLGGPESFADLLKQWGFYSKTGIDLPGEQPGRIPSPAWLTQFCEEVACQESTWRTGDNVNMAIGQGNVLVTPLQLAVAYAAVGNGGVLWEPHVAREVLDGVTGEVRRTIDPRQRATIDIPAEWRQGIVDGLIGVTTDDDGTASGAFAGFPSNVFPVAAKTGTAQVNGKAPTAVFGAFGPAGAPQYAVSVLLEESGYGGSVAAPVARRIFDVLSDPATMPPAPQGGQLGEGEDLVPEGGDVTD